MGGADERDLRERCKEMHAKREHSQVQQCRAGGNRDIEVEFVTGVTAP